jgi:hypothetical protein
VDPEHVEPVRSLALDRGSRARTFLVALVPAFVLIAVIGAAIFGSGRSTDEREFEADRNAEAPVSAAPQPQPSDAPDVAGLREAGFPTRALGLPVQSVARTLELHDAGEIQGEVIAVAGWFSVPPDPACGIDEIDDRPGLYGIGSACRRATILAGDAEPVVAVRSGTLRELRKAPTVMRPVGLSGPSLSSIAARQIAPDRVVLPERAIVLGRFADTRLEECQSSSTGCVSAFAIERVVWVDGSWRLRRPLLFPAEVEPVPSGKVRWPTVDRAIRRGAIILSETIVAREDLAAVDPAADAATPRDAGTVWYVRALLRARGLDNPMGEVGWAVIDDDTAMVLASDPERTTEAAARAEPSDSAAPAPADEVVIPEQMFGLDMLDVDSVTRLAEGGVDPGHVVAVEGWLTVAPDQPGCTELPIVACPRHGTLSGTREPDGPVIAVETLPGTPLLGLTRQSPSLGTWTVPNRVALVGRLREQPSACGVLIRCDVVLTIERLAWLRTAARDRPVLTAPGALEASWTREAAEKAARDAVDGAGATLLLALVDRPTLRLLDAGAWDAAGGSSGSAVWYLRTIAWQSPLGLDGPAVVGWSVVDDRTHAVLGSGVSSGAP